MGLISYPGFNWFNKNTIEGAEVFSELPHNNVLIISNHQTYFAEGTMALHAIYASLKGRYNNIKFPGFLFKPKSAIYTVAAEETMKKGIIPKLMSYVGVIPVKRTWRQNGQDVKRKVDKKDASNIGVALEDGWVISFPQGTTTPFAPGRKGTAHLIKEFKPLVVPLQVDGFRRAFDKRGLIFKKKRTNLKMSIAAPLEINYDDTVEQIMEVVMNAIGQSSDFNKVPKIIPGK